MPISPTPVRVETWGSSPLKTSPSGVRTWASSVCRSSATCQLLVVALGLLRALAGLIGLLLLVLLLLALLLVGIRFAALLAARVLDHLVDRALHVEGLLG